MPILSKMTEKQREAALDALDTQLLAIMEGERKLRERLESVALDSDEALDIKLLLVRLDLKADDTMRKREEFEDDSLPLQPPSATMLATMQQRIGAIRAINVQNETARGILTAIVAVAGQIPKAKTG